MASVTVSMSQPSRKNVKQNQATVSFSDFGTGPSGGDNITVSGPSKSYSYTPSSGSGTNPRTYTGLTAGKAQTLTVTVTYIWTVTTHHPEKKNKDGKVIQKAYDSYSTVKASDSASVIVYTHPVSFSFGFSSNNSIHLKLKADGNWADWCNAIRKYRSWREQSSHYNDALSYNGKSFKASSGQVITAELINAAYSYANGKSTTVVSNNSSNNNSIITAKVFNNLNIAASGDQTFNYTF